MYTRDDDKTIYVFAAGAKKAAPDVGTALRCCVALRSTALRALPTQAATRPRRRLRRR